MLDHAKATGRLTFFNRESRRRHEAGTVALSYGAAHRRLRAIIYRRAAGGCTIQPADKTTVDEVPGEFAGAVRNKEAPAHGEHTGASLLVLRRPSYRQGERRGDIYVSVDGVYAPAPPTR